MSDDPEQTVLTVTMRNVTESDQSWYGFNIEGSWQYEYKDVYISVKDSPALYVPSQVETGYVDGSVTINCYHSNYGEKKWCRIDGVCADRSSGIDGMRVDMSTDAYNSVFKVIMTRLQLKHTGWYYCSVGDLQMPVHITVQQKTTTQRTITQQTAINTTTTRATSTVDDLSSTSITNETHTQNGFSLTLPLRLLWLLMLVVIYGALTLIIRRKKRRRAAGPGEADCERKSSAALMTTDLSDTRVSTGSKRPARLFAAFVHGPVEWPIQSELSWADGRGGRGRRGFSAPLGLDTDAALERHTEDESAFMSTTAGISSISSVSKVSVGKGQTLIIPYYYGAAYRNYNIVFYGYYHLRMTKSDARWYRCEIKDNWQNKYKDVDISVEDSPALYVHSQDETGYEDGSVTINCYYKTNGWKKWCRIDGICADWSYRYIDGERVDMSTDADKGVFTVIMTHLQLKHTGWYYCSVGDLQMPVHITVQQKTTTQRTITQQPAINTTTTRATSTVDDLSSTSTTNETHTQNIDYVGVFHSGFSLTLLLGLLGLMLLVVICGALTLLSLKKHRRAAGPDVDAVFERKSSAALQNSQEDPDVTYSMITMTKNAADDTHDDVTYSTVAAHSRGLRKSLRYQVADVIYSEVATK
ncbi:uncharacterized protein LOC134066508 [Sardina pilchardus]|uniref:uncharacterized protein LOC134066508 n=1 Tax=Sardina pilchardus TaxID=27697 RepID=UPI002E0FBE34